MYHIYTIFIYFGYGANMGTITKRTNPSGAISYRAQVRIKKEGYPSFSESRTFRKRSLAAEWIKKREAEIELNPEILFGDKKKTIMPTVSEAISRYTDEIGTKYGRSKKATLLHILHFDIANKRLNRLKREDIAEYALTRSRGVPDLGIMPVKPSTIEADLQYLRTMIKHAVLVWGLDVTWAEIDLAMTGLRKSRQISKADERSRLPTADELQKLTNYFYRQWQLFPGPSKIPMHLIMWFAIYSARRQGEIGRLSFNDFNRERMEWFVRNVKHPRGSKGNHKYAMVKDELLPVIDALQASDIRHRMIKNGGDTDLVCGGFSSRSVSAAFTRACTALMIDDLRFHDLRHEAATRLAEDGLTIPQMQQITLHGTWEALQKYVDIRRRATRLDFSDAMAEATSLYQPNPKHDTISPLWHTQKTTDR